MVHIPADGDAGQPYPFGDLLAGEGALPVPGEKLPDEGQGSAAEPLAQLTLGLLAPLIALEQAVDDPLVQPRLPLGQQGLQLEELVHGLAEAGKLKGLDQIVQHPAAQQGPDDVRVAGRGHHNDGGGLAQTVQGVDKLQAGHGRGVVVQDNKVGLLVL